jgi:hypothetical protein
MFYCQSSSVCELSNRSQHGTSSPDASPRPNSRTSTSQANIAFTDVYNGFTIEYTNNAQFTAGEQADAVRVLKLGIDAGYFSGTAAGHVTTGPVNPFNRLRIVSYVLSRFRNRTIAILRETPAWNRGVHPFTVFSSTGEERKDPAHLTIQGFTNGEGRWKTHVWTLPIDVTGADANTTLNPNIPVVFIRT